MIKVVGSSSAGNGYIIEDGDKTYCIEAGMPLQSILAKANYIPEWVFVSHKHGDHAKYIQQYINAGIKVITNKQVRREYGLTILDIADDHRVVRADVVHDPSVDTQCMIFESNSVKVGFFTDCMGINLPQVKGLTHLLIETNWSNHTINDDLYHSARSRSVHQSLEQAIIYINNMDINRLQDVYLIHLSDDNASPTMFKGRVKKILPKGIGVHVLGVNDE